MSASLLIRFTANAPLCSAPTPFFSLNDLIIRLKNSNNLLQYVVAIAVPNIIFMAK